MTSHEKAIVEAISTLLQHDAMLGLSLHSKAHEHADTIEHGVQFMSGQISEMFALKASSSPFYESLKQAFSKVHNYKYIDDPTFTIAMEKELSAQGIPVTERTSASKYVHEIIEELQKENDAWAEKDYGFHPNLDEVKEIPTQYE
jgi:hypothetical protein